LLSIQSKTCDRKRINIISILQSADNKSGRQKSFTQTKREGERMVWNGKEGAKKGVAAGESVSERAWMLGTLRYTHTHSDTHIPPHTGTALGPDYFEGRVLSTVVHLFTRQATTATNTHSSDADVDVDCGWASAFFLFASVSFIYVCIPCL